MPESQVKLLTRYTGAVYSKNQTAEAGTDYVCLH
jgi:hypothetical protein